MPFIIICPLCGYDNKGHPIAYFRDAINDQAWIPYAKHILENHPDNFRVHWAEHALKDKNLVYTLIKQVEHELASVKIQSTLEPQILTSTCKPKKTNEATITDFLLKHKQEVEEAQKIIEKPKLSPSVIAKVREKLAKKKTEELLPEERIVNVQVPEYEPEDENPFKDQIKKTPKK
jgi:hypothetical protein